MEISEQYETMHQVRDFLNADEDFSGRAPLAYTKVYGCAQNEADMELIRGMLEQMGFDFTTRPEEADLILINTCAVREGAEFRIYGNVGEFKRLKEKNRKLTIVVCGCMMQQKQVVEKMQRSYPYVDIIFGTHNIARFPLLLQQRYETGKRVTEILENGTFAEGLPIRRENPRSFNVSVMYGCNNFCSYCIVPYTRGRERSRRPEMILEEIRSLAAQGYVEVTLLGQNVNSYGKDLDRPVSFAQLLRAINEIDGLRRIRFMTSHPKDLSDQLIDAMAECGKVCEHLHLPVQSGSNRILKSMNRKYTRGQYLELIDKLRAKIPGIAITTDVIVGFPGESGEDFEDTLDLIRTVRFDGLFSFIFSPRSGTPAAKMPDPYPAEEKKHNFSRLLKEQEEIGYQNNLKYFGETFEVLAEGKSKSNQGMLSGRTRTNKIIHFPGDESLIGQFINVKITKVQTFYMLGEIDNGCN